MAEAPPRLTADQLMVMKLFEIADRLADQTPQGVLTSGELVVTNETRMLGGLKFSLSIYNDGPGSVYIWQDADNPDQNRQPWAEGEAPLRIRETLNVPYRAKTAGIVYLRCKPMETATVRYWKLT